MSYPGDIEIAARAGRKYRCYNCGEQFRCFKVLPQHVATGAQDPDEWTLERHLASTPRCSEAIRAYLRTRNPDQLDNPPRQEARS